MPITNVSRVKTIVLPITNADSNEMVTIYQNSNITLGSDLIPGYKIVSLNAFIKNLKVFASVRSLPEADLPDIQLEDSSAQKIQKVLDIEWKSPRKQLNLFIATNNSQWRQVGSVSLLNPAGYPFRIYNIMDFFTDNLALELGDNSKIGIQFQDVGYGVLTPEDKVTVHGSYIEEFFVESSEQPVNINIDNPPITVNIPPIIINVTGGTDLQLPVTNNLFSNNSLVSNSFLVGN